MVGYGWLRSYIFFFSISAFNLRTLAFRVTFRYVMAWGCINSGKVLSSLRTTYLLWPWSWELCLLVLHLIAGQGVSAEHGSTVPAWESIELSQTEQLSRNGSGGDATGETGPKRGMILPFQPLSITFEDIKYYVDMPAVPTHTRSHFLCFGSFSYIIWSTMSKYFQATRFDQLWTWELREYEVRKFESWELRVILNHILERRKYHFCKADVLKHCNVCVFEMAGNEEPRGHGRQAATVVWNNRGLQTRCLDCIGRSKWCGKDYSDGCVSWKEDRGLHWRWH